MDLEAIWEHIRAQGERFEEFCHEAMRNNALDGRAQKNYRQAETDDSPYDGETDGQYTAESAATSSSSTRA